MKNLRLLILLFCCFELKAQTYDIDTLVFNGDVNKMVNIVILGDGFTTAQMPQFISNAQTLSNYLFTVSPFSQYKNYFNVFIIKAPSVQSGISHPGNATDVAEPVIPVSSVNNLFGGTFDYFQIHRLLVPTNYSSVNTVLANNFPLYDQVLIVANSTEYGGSGGSYATSSIHSAASEVAVHELGHSFAFLADEYWAGDFYAAEKANMTQQTNPTLVKWKDWMNINNIGIYVHGSSGVSASWYRPHQNCKMRYLGVPFCSVCTETIVERIHHLTTPILSYLPTNSSSVIISSNTTFSLTLAKPIPNTLGITWKLNNVSIGTAETQLITPAQLQSGNNTLTAIIVDNTTLSKSSTHASLHTYQVSWTLVAAPCPSTLPLASPTDDINVATTTTKKASQSIVATNKILASNSNVTFQAGNFIELNNKFQVNNQAVFTAKIITNPCN